MALYRCAACGSPNVVTDTQIGGLKYDYLKGAVGTAILGAGGAAAGMKNQQQQVFKCPDCGQTLTYAMPEEVKQLIDIGVMSLDARQRLTLRGTPIEWEFLKNKYKNIEHGVADDIAISREEEKNARKNEEGSLDWQVNLDYTSAEGKAYLDERKAMLDKEMSRLSPKFSREAILEQQQNETKQTLQALFEQRKQLQSELDSLGFFKRAEKEKLRKKLAENQEEIDYWQDALDNPDEEDEEDLEVELEVEKYKMSVYAVIIRFHSCGCVSVQRIPCVEIKNILLRDCLFSCYATIFSAHLPDRILRRHNFSVYPVFMPCLLIGFFVRIDEGFAKRKIISEISRSAQDKFLICQTSNIGFHGLPGKRSSLHPYFLLLPCTRQTVKLYVVHVVIEEISQFSEIRIGRIGQLKDTEHSEWVVYVLDGKFEISAPSFIGIFHFPSCQTVFDGTGIARVENRTKFLIRIFSTFKHCISPVHFGSDI